MLMNKIIILTLLLRSLYLDIRNKQISESIFSNKNINQINDYDLNFALDELNEAILYVSYTDSKEIYKMEKKLYKEKYDLFNRDEISCKQNMNLKLGKKQKNNQYYYEK